MIFRDERLRAALILMAVTLLLSFSGSLNRFDNLLYDLGQSQSRQASPDDVVIVAVDEESLSQLGRWPWSRSLHAALIERLNKEGAQAIALDMIFAEPDTSGQIGDAELAQAIAHAGNVVLPVMLEQSRLNGQLLEVLPLPQLVEGVAKLGSVHAEIEEDGIARGIYLREGLGGAHWPHFSEAIMRVASGRRDGEVTASQETMNSPYLLVRENYRRVPFKGPPGHFKTVSYVQVLTGKYAKDMFRNKIVLVGATAAGLGDRLPTPVSGLSEPMPGVEFHANALQAFREGRLVISMPQWLVLTMTAFACLMIVPVLARLSPRNGMLTSTVLIVIISVAALSLPALTNYWFPPAAVLLAVFTAYPVWSWRRLEAAGRYLDRELQQLQQDLRHFSGSEQAHLDNPDPFQNRIVQIQAASEELRSLRNLIDQVLEGMPHGVVALDESGRAQFANQRAEVWLGLKKGELSAEAQLIGKDGLNSHEITSLSGQPLMVDVAAMPPATGIDRVINLTDISEIKRLESERREMLAFLSHDIRAPLAMAIDQIRSGLMSKETVTRIRNQLSRSHELAEEFLATARAETADTAQFQELDFGDLLHQAVDAVHSIAHAKKVRLIRKIPAEPVWVSGVFSLLERMAVNLIQNAVKYSPPDSAVTVTLNAGTESLEFCVRDSGPGIAPEDRGRLFKRFSRVEGDRQDKVSGMGLGLYFVRVVAERHGGQAGVSSVPGSGAKFCVTLPIMD